MPEVKEWSILYMTNMDHFLFFMTFHILGLDNLQRFDKNNLFGFLSVRGYFLVMLFIEFLVSADSFQISIVYKK